jgi:hypothetical protein
VPSQVEHLLGEEGVRCSMQITFWTSSMIQSLALLHVHLLLVDSGGSNPTTRSYSCRRTFGSWFLILGTTCWMQVTLTKCCSGKMLQPWM